MQEELTRIWDKERIIVSKVQDLKEQLDALKVEIEQCERAYDLNKAAELKYAVLPKLQVRTRMIVSVLVTTSIPRGIHAWPRSMLFISTPTRCVHSLLKVVTFDGLEDRLGSQQTVARMIA